MSIEEPIIETFGTGGLVKAAGIFIIGVIILGGFAGAVQNDNPRSATITLTQIPQAGDTITLGSHTFEFVNSGAVGAGHIPVTIGATLIETKSNFMTVVQENTDFSAKTGMC